MQGRRPAVPAQERWGCRAGGQQCPPRSGGDAGPEASSARPGAVGMQGRGGCGHPRSVGMRGRTPAALAQDRWGYRAGRQLRPPAIGGNARPDASCAARLRPVGMQGQAAAATRDRWECRAGGRQCPPRSGGDAGPEASCARLRPVGMQGRTEQPPSSFLHLSVSLAALELLVQARQYVNGINPALVGSNIHISCG
jgi:hypothetical protein